MRTAHTRRADVVPLLVAIALAATGCGGGGATTTAGTGSTAGTGTTAPEPSPETSPPSIVSDDDLASADVILFTGEAPQGVDNGGYGFAEGKISSPGPTIKATSGKALTLVLENVSDEFIAHDFEVVETRDEAAKPLWGSKAATVDPGESTLLTFTPKTPGTYFYICSLSTHLSGHGMWGRFIVR